MQSRGFHRQQGVSLIGLIFILVFVGLILLVAAKVVPTYSQYQAIYKLVRKSAAEAHTVGEARAIFDRNVAVDYIDDIGGNDLDVERSGDGVVVSFDYHKKIPLAGPVSLDIEYAGKSDRGS